MTTPDGRFWDLLCEETHATWNGRWRWLWRAVAGAVFLGSVLVPAPDAGGGWFVALVALTSWIPAWLGSDLLSLGFAHNPEPQREWPLRAYVARLLGRLLPLSVMVVFWTGPYTFRLLLEDGKTKHGLLDFLAYHSSLEMAGHWTTWMLVFLVSGAPYVLTAALFSSLYRRPRKWLVTFSTMALATSVAGLMRLLVPPLFGSKGSLPGVSDLGILAASSSLAIGSSTVLAVIQNAKVLSWAPQPILESAYTFHGFCLVATSVFLLHSAVASTCLAWIVRCRLRKHPYSRPSVSGRETSPPVSVEVPGT